jgi:hypothetical protein
MRGMLTIAAMALAALAGALGVGRAEEPAPRLAVIVHKRNAAADLDLEALVRIARGEVRTWASGDRIVLILPPAASPARKILLERVLRMSERELKRHFIEKLYGGDLPDYPITARSTEGVLRSVATVEPAIGFALAGEVDATVKVLTIGGVSPEDPRYALTATGR